MGIHREKIRPKSPYITEVNSETFRHYKEIKIKSILPTIKNKCRVFALLLKWLISDQCYTYITNQPNNKANTKLLVQRRTEKKKTQYEKKTIGRHNMYTE